MMKKRIITVLLSLAIVLGMAVPAEATTAVKPINVAYSDLRIYVNGNVVSMQANEEPFIYEGRTFVPIRLVAEALNLDVEWIDLLKTVKITGADANSLTEKDKEINDLKLQLSQKNQEIQSLKDKIESLEADDDVVSDLEDELISDYDYLEYVEIDDISLDGDEDDVDVYVAVDLADYGDEWEELEDRDIEDWIEDLVNSIQDELSDDTAVSGKITDTDSDDVLVKFNKEGDDSLEVDFYDEDYREGSSDSDVEDVLDSLEGDSFYVDDIEFTITDISYYDDEDSVTAILDAVDDDASSEWKDLSSSTINSDVKDICKEIADTFEDDADISLNTVDVYFYDENVNRLDSFDYDVDDGELD